MNRYSAELLAIGLASMALLAVACGGSLEMTRKGRRWTFGLKMGSREISRLGTQTSLSMHRAMCLTTASGPIPDPKAAGAAGARSSPSE